MRHRPLFWLVLIPVALLVPNAHADTFHATRSEALVEKEHEVAITLRRDHAELRVTRTVYNGGERPDQALFHIFPGDEAVAVGLRTQAIVHGEPKWFRGELMEAEAAAAKYRELTGIGGYYPKDPALLSWRSQGHLALQVFPCMPMEEKRVEYTLLVPMRYSDGRYQVRLPSMGSEGVNPQAKLEASVGKALIDGNEAPDSFDLSTPHLLEQTSGARRGVDGDLAMVPFAADKGLLGYHFDAAPRLSEVPDKARIVILIDASHSFGADKIDAARAAAASYLDHFGGSDAAASVLTFARDATPLTQGFLPIADAQKALRQASVQLANGSEVGIALARAGELLSSAPLGTARRIVMFTDLETRSSLGPQVARTSLPGGVVLHIAALEATQAAALERDDDDPWSKLPRWTGGVLWRASSSAAPEHEQARRRVFEELARPLRIDRLRIVGPGLDDHDGLSSLDEGQGIEEHGIVNRYVSFVSLSGEIWSTRFEKTLQPSEAYGRRRAALVFGTPLMHELNDVEMMKLARHGRAVTPVTSYLAIEPGVRPSTEGLDWGVASGEGFGVGGGRFRGVGAGGGGHPDAADYTALLSALMRPGLKRCGMVGERVTVRAESTRDEIVSVSAAVADDDVMRSKTTCIEEYAWGVRLPREFSWVSRRTTEVNL